MRFKSNPTPISPSTPSQVLSISNFKGLNVATTSTEIGDKESPELLNITVDPFGSIEKRKGYARVFQTSLGAGKINGIFNFNRQDGSLILCFSHNTKLYKLVNNLPVEIATPHGLSLNKTKSFVMNDNLYIQDGVNYYQFDGTTVIDVESIAYVPTISISRSPNGLSTNFNESFNLLQPKFIDSFSGNGTDFIYVLSQDHLDATIVIIQVDNGYLTESNHFNVDRTAGTINFHSGLSPFGTPGVGTNNVKVYGSKTTPGIADAIKKCRFNILYGGKNDTKVFMAGNPDDISVLRFSGTYDATYFPDDNYAGIGSNNEPIKGFTLQYDTLIVHKKDSKWGLTYSADTTTGIPYFPVKPINDTIGCIAEDSIALINNDPIALTKTGVYILSGGTVRDERNVVTKSTDIDNILLKESNLQNAIAVDYKNKYILIVNNNGYVYDYYLDVWFKWDNIKASCFQIFDDELYFGSNTEGILYKFYTERDHVNPYNDDNQPIKCHWKSKILSLGTNSRTKNIEKILFSMKPGSPSSVDISYRSDMVNITSLESARRKLFNYNSLDYAEWTYKSSIYPDLIPIKLKAKKIIYFQIIFENNRLNDSMSISNVDIKYTIGGFKK